MFWTVYVRNFDLNIPEVKCIPTLVVRSLLQLSADHFEHMHRQKMLTRIIKLCWEVVENGYMQKVKMSATEEEFARFPFRL